jgi:hypothetical protein
MKIIMDIVEYRNVSASCHIAAFCGVLLVFPGLVQAPIRMAKRDRYLLSQKECATLVGQNIGCWISGVDEKCYDENRCCGGGIFVVLYTKFLPV